ncbi:MAG: polysaccharide deacetylase family protein [Pseudomonas sp.]
MRPSVSRSLTVWRRLGLPRWSLALLVALLSGCANRPPPLPLLGAEPIRFLLTFDDGPSASRKGNPTQSILDDLAHNPVQPGIKALFFVQTRATYAGGSPHGQALLRRQQREGHLLGLHTATPGHANQRLLSPALLEQSLQDGVADLRAITGSAPTLLRPPFWNYNRRTFDAYQAHGLRILLTDLSANDGKTWGIHGSLRRRSHLRNELARVREQIRAEGLPVVAGVIPVVVTFHDLNTYTAEHMQEYLQILLDGAQDVGLMTAAQPFYAQRADLQRAALARSVDDGARYQRLPGLWDRLWH